MTENGITTIVVKNTPKDPVRIRKCEMLTPDHPLQGVQFKLYKISQIDSEGQPKEGEQPIIEGATDVNGILNLGGLEENTSYYLIETATLPGYNLLTGPVVITTAGIDTIVASLNNKKLDCNKVKDENNKDVWEITVYNSTGYELPQTGGIGTGLFTAIGGIITLTAGAALTLKKRKKHA